MMKKQRAIRIVLAGLLVLGMVAGCGKANGSLQEDVSESTESAETPGDATDGDAEEVLNNLSDDTEKVDPDHLTGEQLKELAVSFLVYTNGEPVEINGKGKILGAEDIRYSEVKDAITNETSYYAATYSTYEKKGEYEYDTKKFSRLYSLDGEILEDWSEIVYSQSLGDWVLEGEYIDAETEFEFAGKTGQLVNVKTGETRDSIFYLEKMDENHVAASDFMNGVQGVLDKDGNIVSGFPIDVRNEDSKFWACGQYLQTSEENGENNDFYFYDAELNYLGSVTNINTYMSSYLVAAPYVTTGQQVFNPSEGNGNELESLLDTNDVGFFDGDLAIIYAGEENDVKYYLYDMKEGVRISEGYEFLTYQGTYEDNKLDEVQYFYGTINGEVHKLDRTGKVVAAVDLQRHVDIISYNAGLICNADNYESACLIDNNLECMIPFESGYRDITFIKEDVENPKKSIVSANRIFNGSNQRTDILKFDGTPILEDALNVTSENSGMIGIEKGQYVGVIDLGGQWLAKISKAYIQNQDYALNGNPELQDDTANGMKLQIDGYDSENIPRLDGSLANEPLIRRIMMELTGVDKDTADTYLADSFVNGGTSTSWYRLLDDEMDLIISYEAPEEVKQELADRMDELEQEPLGKDGLVFIVNKDNPVDSLTVDQIRDIYMGKITNWSEVGGNDEPIAAFQRNSTSGSQTLLNKLVMNGLETVEPEKDLLIGTMGELIERVASFDGSGSALGFSVYYYADKMKTDPNLKLLKVNGVEASNETIQDGSYELSNDFYVVIRKSEPADSPARALRDWLLSDDGEKLLNEEGYVRGHK